MGGDIAIYLAVAIALILACTVIMLWCRRRYLRQLNFDPSSSKYNAPPASVVGAEDLARYQIDTSQIHLLTQFNSKTHGLVWAANYVHELVVVKPLQLQKYDANARRKVLDRVTQLALISHIKVVQFIGVSWTTELDFHIILEHVPRGDIESCLSFTHANALATEWGERKLRIASDIAEALAHLHSLKPRIYHTNLRARNILIDHSWGAKISMFSFQNSNDQILSHLDGSSRWIAPEMLTANASSESMASTAVDVYAFGAVMLELDSHDVPFYDALSSTGKPLSEREMRDLLSKGSLQPSICETCPPELAELIADCLQVDPTKRPSAPRLAHDIRQLVETVHDKSLVNVSEVSLINSFTGETVSQL